MSLHNLSQLVWKLHKLLYGVENNDQSLKWVLPPVVMYVLKALLNIPNNPVDESFHQSVEVIDWMLVKSRNTS
jgi:hypothetical protein